MIHVYLTNNIDIIFFFKYNVIFSSKNDLVFINAGIWADDSDEDELSARPSFKTFNKGPKNYRAPVNFVAGGIQQAGKPKDKKDENDEEEDEEEARESLSKHQDDSRYKHNI